MEKYRMLDLDILLKYYAQISHVRAIKQSDIADIHTDPVAFYTEKLAVAAGSAGYTITDEFLFCGKIVHAQTGTVILFGPATEYPLTMDAISRIEKEMGFKRRDIKRIREQLQTLPLISLTNFLQTLSFLNYIMNENDTILPRKTASGDQRKQSQVQADIPVFHNTDEYENLVLQCIEHGRPDMIQAMLGEATINQMSMGKVSNDTLKSLKNVFISSTTIVSRAAVRGGISYDRAMSISDFYIQRSDRIRNHDDFSGLFGSMMTDFASRVADLKLHTNCSDLVRGAARSINGNLYQKITVQQLAQELHVSSSHLSHQFKRETGITLTDYIAQQKIGEAIRLMQTTDLPLAQIAYQLSFSSQSYFHTTFKRITGINPGKYSRERNIPW